MISDSVSTTGLTLTGTLGRLVADAAGVKSNLDLLTQQSSTGQKAQDLSGLGSLASQDVNLHAGLTDLQGWQSNINGATARMGVQLTALDQIASIASNFFANTNSLNGLDASTVDTTAANARDALRQVAGLLNTQSGGVYVFSGRDSANPPVPNADGILSSGFYTQIATAVGNLSSAGAIITAATTLAVASSNAAGTSPFSADLSQPASTLQNARPLVEVGERQYESTGIVASANSVAVSTGSSTTGSYLRDIMRALATLGSLSSAQISTPGFAQLVSDTRDSLHGAISALATDEGALGNQKTTLGNMQTQLSNVAQAITGQVSSIENVDMAATLSALSQTQTQLQASYQMIAAIKDLTLAKYLA